MKSFFPAWLKLQDRQCQELGSLHLLHNSSSFLPRSKLQLPLVFCTMSTTETASSCPTRRRRRRSVAWRQKDVQTFNKNLKFEFLLLKIMTLITVLPGLEPRPRPRHSQCASVVVIDKSCSAGKRKKEAKLHRPPELAQCRIIMSLQWQPHPCDRHESPAGISPTLLDWPHFWTTARCCFSARTNDDCARPWVDWLSSLADAETKKNLGDCGFKVVV